MVSVEVMAIDSITYFYDTIDNSICPTVKDIDGNTYETVFIGEQCWMAENLKVTKYSNGKLIPQIPEDRDWSKLGDNNADDAYCYYNNNENKEADSYGALYTWAAAMGDNATSSNTNPSGIRGICPRGWHLPSELEWNQLADFLGGETVAGGMMKRAGVTHWLSPNRGGDNSSGFNALPGGYRYYDDGSFNIIGYDGYYWSSTESSKSSAWYRGMSFDSASLTGNDSNKSYGFSVRCLKDK